MPGKAGEAPVRIRNDRLPPMSAEFRDCLRELEDAGERAALVLAWGELRTSDVLGRDDAGRYVIRSERATTEG